MKKSVPNKHFVGAATARKRIWFTLKSGQELTIKDIMRFTGAKQTNTSYFLHILEKGGYVAVEGKRPKYYRLKNDTGVFPPIYQKKYRRIYDPNTKKFISIDEKGRLSK